jgi:hypothetical protein
MMRWSRELLLSLALLSVLVCPSFAQGFSKSFRVSPESSELKVESQRGSITVVAAEGNTILITARQAGSEAIKITQPAPDRIRVEVMGKVEMDFVIKVPPHSTLDLFCLKGKITIKNTSGQVQARTTEGDIRLSGLRSPKVEAHSNSGDIAFSGEILPSGSYTFKSFSGRVEVTLPAASDFKLSAASFSGGMDLGGFPMRFTKQTNKTVEGVLGAGRASIHLWTQDGAIHVHRKQ